MTDLSPRRLVISCDGTWNDPRAETNIWRIHDFLTDPSDQRLLTKYVDGVGTTRGTRLKGGAFGIGLSDNVLAAYEWLVETWRESDEIFVFGFSRGAFTARSLCGLIGAMGIVRDADAVLDAWCIYRTPLAERAERLADGRTRLEQAQDDQGSRMTEVKFLGVFDTVGALGVPLPALSWLNRWVVPRFHDTALSGCVEHACQALAIDERRGPFKPVVWSDAPGRTRISKRPQKVLQVWFCGVHGDVGGGYDDRSLSVIPLRWMLARAAEAGLPIGPDALDARFGAGNAFGPRHDSFTGVWNVLKGGQKNIGIDLLKAIPGMVGWLAAPLAWVFSMLKVSPYPRLIAGETQTDDGNFCVAVNQMLHGSVVERYGRIAMPKSLRQATEARIGVFRERVEPRAPDGRTVVQIGKATLRVLDRSEHGLCLQGTVSAQPGETVTITDQHEPAPFRVAWTKADRLGLARKIA